MSIRTQTIVAFVAMMVLLAGTPAAAQPGSQGIQVRGHWEFTIKSADGRVIERRSFDNALEQDGIGSLTSILSRNAIPGRWSVELISEAGAEQPFRGSDGQPVQTRTEREEWIVTAGGAIQHVTTTLRQDIHYENGRPKGIKLVGKATADAGGIINRVATGLEICLGGSAVGGTVTDTCMTAANGVWRFPFRFSSTNEFQPVRLEAGQLLEFTVIITFGSAPHQQPPSH